jgi:hypothetical protein
MLTSIYLLFYFKETGWLPRAAEEKGGGRQGGRGAGRERAGGFAARTLHNPPAHDGANMAALKRIQRELKEAPKDLDGICTAHPIGDDLFNWEGTINGPPESPFEVGGGERTQ